MENTEINAMLSELFGRLREEERDLALLSRDVQSLKEALENHAKEEMEKYDQIGKSLNSINKDRGFFKMMLWILIGVFAAQNEIVMMVLKKLITVGL